MVKRLLNAKVGAVCASLFVSMALLPFIGCGDGKAGGGEMSPDKELQDMRKEMAQIKNEIREMRRSVDRLQMREGGMRRKPIERVDRFGGGMTNGVSRTRYAKPHLTREEMEARRKVMQDPEMRKKFEAERKARMEERRRMHEERRREMEARRNANTAPAAIPSAAPAK